MLYKQQFAKKKKFPEMTIWKNNPLHQIANVFSWTTIYLQQIANILSRTPICPEQQYVKFTKNNTQDNDIKKINLKLALFL